jgi:hypothetical protein
MLSRYQDDTHFLIHTVLKIRPESGKKTAATFKSEDLSIGAV